MATLIPDPCPSTATTSEKRVYALLQQALPDSFHAWYEATIAGRYPDFTVIAPEFGLVMLEIKGWYASQIVKASDYAIDLQRTTAGQATTQTHKHPIRQVREYLFGLLDQINAPEFAILRHAQGEHKGKVCFPCGFGVLLTNITRPQLEGAGISALFPADRVICRDELERLESGDPAAVVARLKSLISFPFAFEPLTRDQMSTLRGAIHREVIVKQRPARTDSVPASTPLPPRSVVLDVLDDTQEQMARSIRGGHQIIFGVAGSGKSSLLLARARMISRMSEGNRVLLVCYNRLLAAQLALNLADELASGRIEIRSFHSWMARVTGQRTGTGETFEAYEQRMIALVLRDDAHFDDRDKFDAILIDEAHDFHPDWFRCVMRFLKPGEEGDLLIAVDGAQSLYGRTRDFTWISVGVQARGRSRRLSRNYRNTKQILEFAWQVSQTLGEDVEEVETNVRVIPTKASRQGGRPTYIACATLAQERAAIIETVSRWRALGIPGQDIAILYPRREHNRIDALHHLLRESFPVSWVSNEAAPDGGVRSLGNDSIKLLTIHSAKGLEFPSVILMALDQLPNPQETDEQLDSNLLYVGLTRATNELVVTWSRTSRFTERVLRSSKADPAPRAPRETLPSSTTVRDGSPPAERPGQRLSAPLPRSDSRPPRGRAGR